MSPTVERIQELFKQHNDTPTRVLEQLGLPRNALSVWRSERANPSVEALVKLSNYFNVSLDYLVTGYEKYNDLSEDEIKWLNLYKQLSQGKQQSKDECIDFIKRYLQGYIKPCESDSENITERIKNVIKTNEALNQKDLSSYLKKAPSTISQWLTQNRDIPAEYIIPICEYLGCSVNWLLTGTNHATDASSTEQKLLSLYRQADERGKRNIMRQAEAEISELPSANNQTSLDSKIG